MVPSSRIKSTTIQIVYLLFVKILYIHYIIAVIGLLHIGPLVVEGAADISKGNYFVRLQDYIT
jgi:hypothetical protein